jgi:cyclic-di-GMP-binding biofilm dispersal mediator protein
VAAIELAGTSVIVTGATGGLGGALARELAGRGARLTLTGRRADRLADVAASLLGADGTDGVAAALAVDLTGPGAPEQVVAAALAAHGAVNGVVNAAGVVAFGPLADTTDDVLEALFAVNVLAPLRLVRAALPHLGGGFVVDLSAVVAEQPVAGMVAYSATKGALTAADTALARELRRDRIHVLDARPPHTETGLAGRPIAGTAPTLPTGLDPAAVASTIVDALTAGERSLPAESFAPKG